MNTDRIKIHRSELPCNLLVSVRIRRMGKVVFTGVCLSTPGEGGTPVPGSFQGHWSQVLSRAVPQSQVLSQVTGPRSFLGGGVPQSWQGYPLVRMGYPPPPGQVRMGYSRGQDCPPPPPQGQNNRACTCYAAGGMPLAFTQEDCLFIVCSFNVRTNENKSQKFPATLGDTWERKWNTYACASLTLYSTEVLQIY